MTQLHARNLNIGAGQTYIPGFRNLDISSKADVCIDIGKERLPFENDSIDLVFSYHCLEHVGDYLFALSEIHRVLKHGGRFLVGVPYVTLTEYHLVNPYHLHNFNEFSFDFFDTKKLKGHAVEENAILFNKVFHRFHYIGMFRILPPPFRSWSRRHLFNVVRKIDFGLIAIKNQDEPIPAFCDKKALQQRFDECLRSRMSYDEESVSRKDRTVRTLLKRLRRWWAGHT